MDCKIVRELNDGSKVKYKFKISTNGYYKLCDELKILNKDISNYEMHILLEKCGAVNIKEEYLEVYDNGITLSIFK